VAVASARLDSMESVNGSRPASSNGSGPSDDDNADGTEFDRFKHLTRQLLKVPKAELDRRREQAKSKTPARS